MAAKPLPSGRFSLRVYETGTGTTDFADNDFTFAHPDPDKSKDTVWSHSIAIASMGNNPIEFSFDGTNVHGSVAKNTRNVYRFRHEAGIFIRGNTIDFVLEAW